MHYLVFMWWYWHGCDDLRYIDDEMVIMLDNKE